MTKQENKNQTNKDIPFSFCIITGNDDAAGHRIDTIIDTIRLMRVPEFEVIIIGGEGVLHTRTGDNIKKIDFDESVKEMPWLTKKKNEVIKHCKHENVVMLHDYFKFHFSWYFYYKKFFNKYDYDICCNPILMLDHRRDPTDWVTWDHPAGRHIALPYSDWSHTKNQYISGGYFIVKKKFLEENPFNEEYTSGDGEDVEWSLRVRDKAKIICNPYSYCQHIKPHRNQRVALWDVLL